MKATPVWGWSLALLISMTTAYLTWTRDRSKPRSDVVALSIRKADVTGITLKGRDFTTELTPRDKDVLWLNVTRMVDSKKATPPKTADAGPLGPQPAPADGGTIATPDGGAPAVEKEKEQHSFRGNASAVSALDKLAPMDALRQLGKLEGAALEPFGLVTPKMTLTVTTRSSSAVFDVGERPYGGSDYYIRRQSDGEVFIIKGAPIADMENAHTRLVERKMHAFKLPDAARAVVESPQGSRELVQLKREENDGKDAYWADAASSATKNELFQNWIQKVHRLTATRYLLDGAPKDARPILTLTWHGTKEELGKIEIVATGEDASAVYFGKSENSLAWVELGKSQSSEVARDLKSIVGE